MEISEVQKWLSPLFKELDEISVEIEGTSEKGDGYMGDILFATIKGIAKSRRPEEIYVVLKCSKNSDQLREKLPVQAAFLNEIIAYESVLPDFLQFELEHGIKDPFTSVPKYYGKFVTKNREVLVFENLKKAGYDLWNRKLPLPREYVRKVLHEYAKFHAISVAMQDQQPERFKQLAGQLVDIFKLFKDFFKIFESNLDDISQLLRGVLDDSVLDEWNKLRTNSDSIFSCVPNESEMTVITHSDCWCNNFMFQPPTQNHSPIVAIIDWQVTRPSSPLLDLAYFLFATVSKEDISTLNELLDEYYQVFTDRLSILGTSPGIYSKIAFLKDWKKYCCYGLLMSSVVVKVCLSEQDEIPDIMDTVTKNQDFAQSFSHEIGNKEALKERMAYIIEYAVREGLLKNLPSNNNSQ